MKSLFILIASLMIASFSVFATDESGGKNAKYNHNKALIEVYKGMAEGSIEECKWSLKLISINQNFGGLPNVRDKDTDFLGCIEREKPKINQVIIEILKIVKKPKAKEALKSYHVTLITALEGIKPGADERKINYEQRQQAFVDKLSEAWARFEVEQ